MTSGESSFPAFVAKVQARFDAARRAGDAAFPELPFALAADDGRVYDAMRQLRGTLAGLAAIVLALAAGITAIFTHGAALTVLFILTAIAGARWLLHRNTLRRLGAAWRRDARPFPAALVMAHNSLMQPGQSIMPGTMLVDFGGDADPERLVAAARAFFALAEREPTNAAEGELAAWLHAEMQRARFGRIRVPKALAGSDDCWAVSLRFDRAQMPAGHVDRSVWFVLARADRAESAEILPPRYWAEQAGAN